MRSKDHPVEIQRREANMAVNAGRSRLRGFWNDRNNVPSEPVLIFGDPEKFERDLAAYKKRQARRAQADTRRYCGTDARHYILPY